MFLETLRPVFGDPANAKSLKNNCIYNVFVDVATFLFFLEKAEFGAPKVPKTEPKSTQNGGLEPSKWDLKSKIAQKAGKWELWDPVLRYNYHWLSVVGRLSDGWESVLDSELP